jgi:CRP-like cAMP-binding protein
MNITEAIQMSLGKGLTNDQVAAIAELATTRTFMGGDTIVRQFDRNSDLIVILEGSAIVKSFQGEKIAEVGPGSSVGEISLIDDQPRSATVHSSHGTTAALIPSDQLRGLMEADTDLEARILRNICRTLCSRLRVATIQLDGLMIAR